MNNTEVLIRKLCWQDEMISDVKYTEEEIQKFLHDKDPFIARMISGSIKLWKLENGETNEM